jgi:hypothetical protein
MKLNQLHKQAFVAAVMGDIPKIDFEEKMRKFIMSDMIAQAPKEVAEVLKIESLRRYVIQYESYRPQIVLSGGGGRTNAGLSSIGVIRGYEGPKEGNKEFKLIMMASHKQLEDRTQAEANVRGAIFACSTHKQASERMPEFAKYLPENTDHVENRLLPSIANLAAELTKMGWPKNKQAVA